MSNIQLRTADGQHDGQITLAVYDAGTVTMSIYDADGRQIVYSRDIPAATARKLAAELLACSYAAGNNNNT